ncbi:catalase family peroxidase [Bordetella genomosp. 13]|uniref:Catalase-related peroxidase n=1 Tax=Bordetella genomosp. 13 TaxID=463040 RepID=A0A1W6ZFT8_9BORD|nr:catalase family peroxidase [Bordetella genomosp. 13]ARP96125.1 catalase [Bordetella genomosp. 13]
MTQTSTQSRPAAQRWRWLAIAGAVAGVALAFGYAGGWLAPQRLTPQKIVDSLQANGGLHPGYRRNHAKGVCVSGYFEGAGTASAYSTAPFFKTVRTPVVGRFALPGGNPYAPDNSVPIRSLALRLAAPDGQQWRMGMNAMPVFPLATPEAFYEQALAGRPDPQTGKPDPAKLKAFFGAHPEAGAFLAWVKTARPGASYATETYHSLNAFYLVDGNGKRQAVRWAMVPQQPDAAGNTAAAGDANVLQEDLVRRIAAGVQRWKLMITLAAPDDPVDDATKTWPADRTVIDAGTLVLSTVEPQDNGPCRDINFDPTVLPEGIRVSGDPLLAARSAAYADSYLRRTSEEAGLPGAARMSTEKQ